MLDSMIDQISVCKYLMYRSSRSSRVRPSHDGNIRLKPVNLEMPTLLVRVSSLPTVVCCSDCSLFGSLNQSSFSQREHTRCCSPGVVNRCTYHSIGQSAELPSCLAPDAISHCDTILPSTYSSADEKPPKPGTASLLGARAGSWLVHSPTVVGEAKLAFGPGDAG